jgi:hypothetical protein
LFGAVVVGALVVLTAFQLRAATKLTGTWLLVTMSIDSGQWGRPAIDTELIPPAFHDESLTIEIEVDMVTVVTTRRLPFPVEQADQYQVDGQPHPFEVQDDSIDRETAIRTTSWTREVDGLDVIENYGSGRPQRHRWTVSTDGQVLTIESTFERPCPPCAPSVTRILRVFRRQA